MATSFKPLGNAVISIEGEQVIWKSISSTKDPEYGSKIEQQATQTDLHCIINEVTEAEIFQTAGEIPECDAIGYIKAKYDVGIDDIIVRNPNSGDQRKYNITEINDNQAYKELALKVI